ncbi:MAG: SCP2 sterol-binding domain-containing protein [Alphaproteobacteria bacterium]
MSLEEMTAKVKEKVGEESGLGATLKFAFEDDTVIFVDATKSPNEVSNDDKDADCTLSMTVANFQAMMDGDLDATMAYMSGKLKIDGNMGIAMKLGSVL